MLMRRVRCDETGAMAVIVALMSVVLFGMAAVAVELTDMYAKDRASQTTADLSAMAGAQGLPDSCTAFNTTLANLNASFPGSPADQANGIRDSRGREDDELTSTQLSDRDLANGEIQVLTQFTGAPPANDPAVWLNTSACETSPGGGNSAARFVRVLTPARTTDFTFVLALPSDTANPVPTSGDVQSVATSAVRSPSFGDTFPVFLPNSCGFGPNYVITDSPSADGPGGSPNYNPDGAKPPSKAAPVVQSVTSSVVTGGRVQQIFVTVSGLAQPATMTSTRFDLHTGSQGSTVRFPVVPPKTTPTSLAPLALITPSPESAPPYTAVYEVQLGVFVTSRGGEWFVRATETGGANAGEYTNTNTKPKLANSFSVEAAAAPGCGDPATGNFGLLAADRPGTGDSFQLAHNMIEGIDFSLAKIPVVPPVNTKCTADGSPTTALLSLRDPSRNGANCLDIYNGPTRGPITDGLITGAGGLDGRLYSASSPSVPAGCTEPKGPGDTTSGDFLWKTPITPGRPTVWNTQLSCYLPSGTPLSALQTCDGCLDADIVADPRYFLVPVLNVDGRPRNGQWPIVEFRGAFITNEVSGSPATCKASDKCNGIELNQGEQTVFGLQTFIFPLSALPDEVPTTTGDGTEYSGVGPRDFLLVE